MTIKWSDTLYFDKKADMKHITQLNSTFILLNILLLYWFFCFFVRVIGSATVAISVATSTTTTTSTFWLWLWHIYPNITQNNKLLINTKKGGYKMLLIEVFQANSQPVNHGGRFLRIMDLCSHLSPPFCLLFRVSPNVSSHKSNYGSGKCSELPMGVWCILTVKSGIW